MTKEHAYRLRALLEQAAQSLSDKEASEVPAFYPKLKGTGELVKIGTKINWNGVVKRASVDLWDTPENDPDNAPVLWEDINYREGIRIIPKVITVGLVFGLNELGWWGDEVYKSLIPANAHTPEQNPAGWKKV